MKLVRFGKAGAERPAVMLDDGSIIDVSACKEDYDETFFATDGINRLRRWLQGRRASCPIVAAGERLGPPVKKPSKIICIGLNYALHAKESGAEVPREPVLFFKAPSALSGPNDDVVIPQGSEKTDWEVELAVVIGKRANYVSETDALQYVAGYALHNDISERAFQLEHCGQWVKGKSADSFAPLGPFLATRDEIAEPHALNLWLKLNGEIKQSSNTSDMVYQVPFLVSYISRFMSLMPGDIISTGTPSGVGMGLNPQRFLRPGDVVELGIDGLGVARQNVVAWRA